MNKGHFDAQNYRLDFMRVVVGEYVDEFKRKAQ